MALELRTSEHVYIAGKTRSGKSVLTRSFIPTFHRVVYHDRKIEHTDLVQKYHFGIVRTVDQLAQALQKGGKRILYQPADGSVDDFDLVCEEVFMTGNMVFAIDEAASYIPSSRVPYYTGELLRLGSGRGIGVWSLTQRPRDVANVLLSESSMIISYKLGLKTDRVKIVQTVGTHIPGMTLSDWRSMIDQPLMPDEKGDKTVTVDEILRTLPQYHFMLYDAHTEHIGVCAPIKMV